MTHDDRAYSPHCDSAILHAPGKCEYCDGYPVWQAYRELARIAFTGEANELGVKPSYIDGYYSGGIAPCPSTWRRSPEKRDRWAGNRRSR